MPRKPQNISILRNIRQSAGKTQIRFSQMIECKPGTLRSVELEKIPLSIRLAKRIKYATGCQVVIQENNLPKLLEKDWLGRKYSMQSYLQWEAWLEIMPSEAQNDRIKEYHNIAELLFKVAKRRERFFDVYLSLMESILGTATEFGLQKELITEYSAQNTKRGSLRDNEGIDFFAQFEKLLGPTPEELAGIRSEYKAFLKKLEEDLSKPGLND